ncbi:unnamed protein product [Ectocarpus fasciculatus]
MHSEEDPLMQAATVVILRRTLAKATTVKAGAPTSGWDVLLGQNCVKNWLRSTPGNDVIMRYPGEWKFPGGVIEDSDASLDQTATRELREEFLGVTAADSDISLFLVNKKLTKPIKGKRYLMHNYIAMEDDNAWISESDIESEINSNLQKRFDKFNAMLADGSYWKLNVTEKSLVSPELSTVQWMPLDDAIYAMGSSLDDRLICVNDWQRIEFEKYNIHARDPMFQSMVTLLEVQKLGSYEKIRSQDDVMRASNEPPSYYS